MDNTLSIPFLQEQIDVHERAIKALKEEAVAKRYPRVNRSGDMFYCTRCGSLFQAWQGCGCAIPALLDQIDQLKVQLSAVGKSENTSG